MSLNLLQALAAVAGLSPSALSGLVASTTLVRDSPGAVTNSSSGTGFAAAADAGVQHAAATLPQQVLRQLLALVPHTHVPPTIASAE